MRERFDRVDQRNHREKDEADACRVHASELGPRLGTSSGARMRNGARHWNGHEEDGTPLEVLEQETSRDRTERGTAGEPGSPHTAMAHVRRSPGTEDITDERER